MQELLSNIKNCQVCKTHLKDGVNPVVSASKTCKLIIIGQAPGRKVHESNIPWNDKSGDALRKWLDMDESQFYNKEDVALIPMGFCYPGTGKSGDLPPRPECAPLWHQALMDSMPNLQLTLLIGQYAQNYYLKQMAKPTLTETVKNFKAYLPAYLPLPHPSPRNNIWMAKNEWFSREVLPELKSVVQALFKTE